MKLVPSLLFAALCASLSAEQAGPWNLDALKNDVPAMTWLRRDQAVQSLTYRSEAYQGQPTDVFAFYASPLTLGEAAAGATFPGIVLIHGGGGTAFAEWVHLWAKRGYAAIAMDLSGTRPPDPEFDPQTKAPLGHESDPKRRTRLPRGGPNGSAADRFGSIGGGTSDDWPYHAIAAVIRAHTLLRSFPEVDAARTAVTGGSWGGYTTCMAASLDDRFKAAVPVYGCGFLHEGESVMKPNIDKLGDRRDEWVRTYDASIYLPRCRVPIFFVNGTNDIFFPLDSHTRSVDLVRGEKLVRIQVAMPHGQAPTMAPPEIGLFIDTFCRGGQPLPHPGQPVVKDGRVEVTCETVTALKEAQLHYTTDTGLRSARKWVAVPATIVDRTVTAPAPPAAANTWFVAVTDERGAMVTTRVQLVP